MDCELISGLWANWLTSGLQAIAQGLRRGLKHRLGCRTSGHESGHILLKFKKYEARKLFVAKGTDYVAPGPDGPWSELAD